jgi:hypothetical protein
MTATREWNTWHNMKLRCYNEADARYEHYGKLGIRVCERWLESFENFLADMGPHPGAGYSIERNDSKGDYEPSNCRWATTREQNRNKGSNVWITAFGRTQLAVDWSRETGLSQTLISFRLKRGKSPEEALSPIKHAGRCV